MKEDDLEETVRLVSVSMNVEEAAWARQTMEFYFSCSKHGIDSGRQYYVWRDDGKICGLVGLHRYIWGSEENVWLSWFAVHPKHQDRGIGSTLMDAVKEHAARAGYKKLLIETYDSPTFKKARSFYRARGFRQVGRVENYLPDGSAMIVFAMPLTK
jgi:ribosomal protein S18 acetylase RimI-like enzyme